MKFMEIINKLQAALTELRREIQREYAGTTRECTCVSGVVGDDCPLHKHLIKPDLPLHARVAKALGEEVAVVSGNVYKMLNKQWPETVFPWIDIPDYPNDLVAARDAFDLYFELQCRKIDDRFDYWIERFYKDGWKWRVRLGFADRSVVADSLEEGLCLAIVAHSEQR